MENLKRKAYSLGATEFGKSRNKNKKYYVVYNGRVINFGQKGYSDYTQHKDENRRKAYIARHSKIRNKEGKLVINDKNSPSYWSLKILWD